ncbi:MAG: hypothetical protein J6M26_02040 [Clostridia bacterium]|nr:hypothetical protein [Clostridia bacterium]
MATIVMVLILAVSLTTATYAWFSSQASATVDDLEIKTQAADGLQIAMVNTKHATTDLQSGELEYNGSWVGAQQNWGSFLGFAAVQSTIGTWKNAVTKTPGTEPIYTRVSAPASFDEMTANSIVYIDAANGTKINIANQTEFEDADGGVWCKETTKVDGKYYVPTGYDQNVQPIAFYEAAKNNEYIELDIAVTNITAIYDLGMGIMISPSGTNAGGTTADGSYPGMAAASRIEIELYKDGYNGGLKENKDGGVAVSGALEPWGAWTLLASGQMDEGVATSVKAANGNYQIVLDEFDAAQQAGAVWYVTIRIWIEGTDNECDNRTAGTGYTVDIEFVYTKASDGELDFKDTNTDSTNLIVEWTEE